MLPLQKSQASPLDLEYSNSESYEGQESKEARGRANSRLGVKRTIAGERGLEIDVVVLSKWPNKEIKGFRNYSMGLEEKKCSRGNRVLITS